MNYNVFAEELNELGKTDAFDFDDGYVRIKGQPAFTSDFIDTQVRTNGYDTILMLIVKVYNLK